MFWLLNYCIIIVTLLLTWGAIIDTRLRLAATTAVVVNIAGFCMVGKQEKVTNKMQ